MAKCMSANKLNGKASNTRLRLQKPINTSVSTVTGNGVATDSAASVPVGAAVPNAQSEESIGSDFVTSCDERDRELDRERDRDREVEEINLISPPDGAAVPPQQRPTSADVDTASGAAPARSTDLTSADAVRSTASFLSRVESHPPAAASAPDAAAVTGAGATATGPNLLNEETQIVFSPPPPPPAPPPLLQPPQPVRARSPQPLTDPEPTTPSARTPRAVVMPSGLTPASVPTVPTKPAKKKRKAQPPAALTAPTANVPAAAAATKKPKLLPISSAPTADSGHASDPCSSQMDAFEDPNATLNKRLIAAHATASSSAAAASAAASAVGTGAASSSSSSSSSGGCGGGGGGGDESRSCPICFRAWTNVGPHHVCTLRCGHLFGRACILACINHKKTQTGKCPLCKQEFKKRDVIDLFIPAAVTVLDTSHTVELQKERELRRSAEAKLALSVKAHELLMEKFIQLRQRSAESETTPESSANSKAATATVVGGQPARSGSAPAQLRTNALDFFKFDRKSADATTAANTASTTPAIAAAAEPTAVGAMNVGSAATASGMFRFVSTIKVDSSRVLDIEPCGGAMFVSTRKGPTDGSSASSAPFGVLHVSGLDSTHREYIALHRQPLKDVKHSPAVAGRPLLLTVGLDKTIKVCDVQNRHVAISIPALANVPWSCAWNYDDTNICFVGSDKGEVLVYDLRMSTSPLVSTLLPSPPASATTGVAAVLPLRYRQPLHSLSYVSSAASRPAGLLAGTFAGPIFWEWTGTTSPIHDHSERYTVPTPASSSSLAASGGSFVSYKPLSAAALFYPPLSTAAAVASHQFGVPKWRYSNLFSTFPAGVQSPVDGQCIYAGFDPVSGSLLATQRAGKRIDRAQHAVFKLTVSPPETEAESKSDSKPAAAVESDSDKENQTRAGASAATASAASAVATKLESGVSIRTDASLRTAFGHSNAQVMSRATIFSVPARAGAAAASAVDPDSCVFIASGDETSRQPFIWNAKSGEIVQKLRSHTHTILDVRYRANGTSNMLAALSEDQLTVYHTKS